MAKCPKLQDTQCKLHYGASKALAKVEAIHLFLLPLAISEGSDEGISQQQSWRKFAINRGLKLKAKERWEGGARPSEGIRGCSKIRDFSYCPNKYLLNENLCPTELPIRQSERSECRNRTCPYREGSCGEREQEGAGVKYFPRMYAFHWHRPSEKSPRVTQLEGRLATIAEETPAFKPVFFIWTSCWPTCENATRETPGVFLPTLPLQTSQVLIQQWLSDYYTDRANESTKTQGGKSVFTNTPQISLLPDTAGLHSNPAGQ